MLERQYLERALAATGQLWEPDALAATAAFIAPDRILGRRRALLLADMHHLWARWFVEGIVDPRQFEDEPCLNYPRIYLQISEYVALHFTHLTNTERRSVTSIMAQFLFQSAKALRYARSRSAFSRDERRLLLDLAGDRPSCWICGKRFAPVAIDNFLGATKLPIPRPLLYDILRPAGLNVRDLQIEIDHVMPHAEGGSDGDNLRLACGWCNGHKHAWSTLYQASGASIATKYAGLGSRSLPQPFWVVRILGTIRKCEHQSGCDKTSANSELTVAPLNRNGALNPTNLMVTCYDHDPIARGRFVSLKVAASAWNK